LITPPLRPAVRRLPRAVPALLLAALVGIALAAPARAVEAPTRRFAVVAGASLGGEGRTPLRYATSDARDVARVLRRLGGVALDDLTVVEEPDADRLRRALRAVGAATDRARKAGSRIELFVYYSGHSDEEGLLLASSRLSYAELRRELDGVPADVRVAILDSCSSGAITRAKGGVHRPPFLLDAASRVSGHAFLTSSAADEAAQESDRLRASFFTHALLTGLRGAADASADGVVTLNEAYQFAFRETLARTETSRAGPQHATYDIGLVGSGDVVMTDLRRADGILVIPEGVDGRVFVRNAGGALVAELRKAPGARIELALEEGRYEVRVVREARAAAAVVTLPGDARVVLDEERLHAVPLEATATRGAGGPGVDLDGTGDAPLDAAGPSAAAQARGPGAGLPVVPAPPPLTGVPPVTLAPAYVLKVRGGGLLASRDPSPAGFVADLAATAWFGDVVGLELATGYLRFAGTTNGRLPGEWTPRPVRDEVTALPTRLAVLLGLPARPARPYLLAGAGVTFVHLDRYATRTVPMLGGGTQILPIHLGDDARYLSLHAGVGLDVRIARSLAATIEVRYAFGPAVDLVGDEVNLAMASATAGLAWTF
jgi:hypothetical protein